MGAVKMWLVLIVAGGLGWLYGISVTPRDSPSTSPARVSEGEETVNVPTWAGVAAIVSAEFYCGAVEE